MPATREAAPVVGALDRALASLEWVLSESQRTLYTAGQRAAHPPASAGFSLVSAGAVSMRVGAEWIDLEAGDVLFYPRGRLHEVRAHAGADANVVSISFSPTEPSQHTLDRFPDALLVTRFHEHEPNLAALIDSMARCVQTATEAAATKPRRDGDLVVCGLMTNMIVSSIVRQWVELGCAPERWLHRVTDPFISRALDALHAEPGRAWSVQDLARVAAMSRSSFAERFHTLVGQTPASYLTGVRMEAGMDLLTRQGLSIADTAHRLGYESEAGFSRAFRRHTGSAPALWREGRRALPQPAA
ncbi:AraC-like DNA-binding protein [Mycetocola sp. BIGb0189]|uniref:AraC family transcriptional regulator n=1 Tax=Mycetocola sp. BIGb0189 TaxID=2940604 RepID=UPI00216A386F|nr:AraC family transcriptional regulator [Mycetocola sp. BIGb0189]MCS4276502.1 AraC-like DNA-binding protein [Mycetocola sp. BIGb0189]